MRLGKGKSETAKLQETVDRLPKRAADWTPAQRQQYTDQSDRAMREQAGVQPDAS
ncbi:hypothetical protein [Streptomyces sp. NBC_00557]|uniref:hypothetical protein n=1 Tax=Streptomyces sp. NBC_00557 TaxID=2975776 RepID=UPI002E80ED4F|nr:hypothetical protein [Streptomyces sp. NBC_00557]WUC36379.1 hypothetical protein OG956_20220 [Streptomyces sp. NBC_00557]